jgi:glycosyltransferase involved in cell wall biosynthesis
MPSIHVNRWVENLKFSRHDIYWFDVMARGSLNTPLIPKEKQFVDWRKRKLRYIKGEYFLSKKMPVFFSKVQPVLEITAAEYLEYILKMIKPDLVHSFELQSCSFPILKTMKKYPDLKWVYSCWGSDLYYYSKFKNELKKIKSVLNRVDYLIADCYRDQKLSIEFGFKGKVLDVIYGGGGFDIEGLKKHKLELNQRKIILVKGYEHNFGRALNVIKALTLIPNVIGDYEVHVFGTHEIVQRFIEQNNLPFKIYGRHNLSHKNLLELMGKSLIYLGNSISDGMPNTLLEAIIMGAFPIQSNPGNVTEEIITNGDNGFLIENPDSVEEIKTIIVNALKNKHLLHVSFEKNNKLAYSRLSYNVINNKIMNVYTL